MVRPGFGTDLAGAPGLFGIGSEVEMLRMLQLLKSGIAPRWGLSLCRLRRDRRGAIAVTAALSLTLLCGMIGLSTDIGMWYWQQRKMQNAADAAALAAAIDGIAGNTTYKTTGADVAKKYGYTNGTGSISVTIPDNDQTCPDGTTTCYKATISQTAPQYFTAVLGLTAPTLTSSATVSPTAGKTYHQYCLVGLASSGTNPAILANGVPNANLAGCSVLSNTGMTCHGHNLNADFGDAVGTDSGCGNGQNSGVSALSDPYSYLSSNIPSNTCASYPQEPSKKKDPALPSTNQWPNSVTNSSLAATVIICGDLQLTANTVLTTASPGTVLVIENGQLDTNGFELSTASGSALTIIFTGSNGSYTHAPTGGGTLDFNAPTSGTWSGIAIYQDPSLTSGVNISAAGNSPTWDITGVIYLPHSSVTLSGAVGKGDNGSACFVLVVDNVTFNGTGNIESHGGCAAAGVKMPTDTVPGPGLVM